MKTPLYNTAHPLAESGKPIFIPFGEWKYDGQHRQRLDRVATRSWHTLGSRLCEQLLPLSNIAFYAAGVLLLLHGGLPWGMVLLAVVLKWAWQIVAMAQPAKRFDAGLVYLAAPLMEIYFIIANTFLILTPLPSNRKFKK